MFKKLSRTFAWQFTGLVFVLLLITGIIYIATDYINLRQTTTRQLTQEANSVSLQLESPGILLSPTSTRLTRRDLAFIRIINPDQSIQYSGELFQEAEVPIPGQIPSNPSFSSVNVQGDNFRVITVALPFNGQANGLLQIATQENLVSGDLPRKIALFTLVSLVISGLTFLFGLQFAQRNLKPVKQSMERLEQFTQDASHELRTPLTVLHSTLDLALKTGNYREGIESAKQDLTEATRLVERLLELASLDQTVAHKSLVDLAEIIEEIIEKVEPLARENEIKIETIMPKHFSIGADPGLISQIIRNLLSNALKFTPSSGTILIELTKNHLKIKDTGIGMETSVRERIFERFYQAEPSRSEQGYGLGLAIVKKIIDMHHWTIKVESEKGKGSSFIVYFN